VKKPPGDSSMKKKKNTRPENKQPLDKKQQELVSKIRKEKKKKDDKIANKKNNNKVHCEFWEKEKNLGKPIEESFIPVPVPVQCTTSAEKQDDMPKRTFWEWLKSIFKV
jgi:hypothetical protein